MCYTLPVVAREESGFDRFLRSSIEEDSKFRRLFRREVAKLPARSRQKLEKNLKPLPK